MRVLQIVHGFSPNSSGGAELYARGLALELASTFGDAVTVMARDEDVEAAEFRVRHEPSGPLDIYWINNTFRTTRRFSDTYDNPDITAVAARVIDEVRPDVAHVHHLTCLSTTILDELARRRIPIVLTLHDYWLICHRGQLLDRCLQRCDGPGTAGCASCIGIEGTARPLAFAGARVLKEVARLLPGGVAGRLQAAAGTAGRRLSAQDASREASLSRLMHMRERFARVTAALAPSAHLQRRFAAAGFDAGKVRHWPYGTDVQPRRHVPRGDAPLRLTFLGSLMASKAPHVAMDAVRQVYPAARLRVYGGPADYHGDASYRRLLDGRSGREGVTIAGPLDHDRVGTVLAESDALVVSSVWEENSPIVIHEALAAGVPVLASRIGGIPELIAHEVNGLLFEPGDSGALARHIQRLAGDDGLLDRLRQGITPPRTRDDDVRSTRGLYEQLAAERRVSPTPPASGMTRRSTTASRISAVVLNYRTPDQTAVAARMLQMSDVALADVVVVDNGDGTAMGEALDAGRASVTLIATGANLGFSAGCNAGIRHALDRGADAVLLVNSDVVVPPDCVGKLAITLDRDPTVGITAPVICNRAWPLQVTSAGLDFDAGTGRMRQRTTLPDSATCGVGAVSGCVMLVRREVFTTIGLLPEDYFFSFEDIDFCQRARNAGFAVRIEPEARAYHEGSGTIGHVPQRLYYATRNHLRLGSTTPAGSALHRLARQWAIAGYNLAHAMTSRDGRLPSRLAAVTRGIADHLSGHYGAGRL